MATTSKRKAPPRRPAPARGPALVDAIRARLAAGTPKIGLPSPLSAAALRACEDAAGVALSPAMHALLSHDAGLVRREYGWFDRDGRLLARPPVELVRAHSPAFESAFASLLAARFPGKALPLDAGSDSMRMLYLGDPDAHGEYPVLFIDVDDAPILGVEVAGFDLWLAAGLGLTGKAFSREAAARCTQLLGVPLWHCFEGDEGALPRPVPGPAPGSVVHPAPTPALATGPGPALAPPAPRKRLTDKQLAKALAERATDGDAVGARELAAIAVERGRTAAVDAALVAAARAGALDVIDALLAAGASPNARDHYACALACVVHHADAIALATRLLAAGADPNGPSVNGETALHQAVEHGTPELVALLCARGADPTREDDSGMTPLHAAVVSHPSGARPDPRVVDVLCDAGADPDGGSNHSRCLHWAIEAHHDAHVARLLARGADVDGRATYRDRTPLHAAYEYGNDAAVRMLCAAGADRSLADDRGIALTEIYGPAGEDVRPITVRYAASAEPQEVRITARFAVLGHLHLGGLAPLGAGWARVIEAGLAALPGARPGASRAEVLADPPWSEVIADGMVTRRWRLRVTAVAPRFWKLCAAELLGAASAYTGAGTLHTIRGVALAIEGTAPGGDLDGPTLRAWLADPEVQLAATGPSPVPIEVEPGRAEITIVPARATAAAREACEAAVRAWLQLAPIWPHADPELAPVVALLPPDQRGTFGLLAFDRTGRDHGRFPFAREPAIAALTSAVRTLHAAHPLTRVAVRLG